MKKVYRATRVIYSLATILMITGCITDSNPDTQMDHPDTLVVLAKERIYHKDGTRTYSDWKGFQTRTVNHLAGYEAPRRPVKLNKYGGRLDRKVESTGFFYVRKMDGRWWGVDPEGCLCYHLAVNSIKTGTSDRNTEAFEAKFGSMEKWINETNSLLHKYGFNGSGSWSDTETIISSRQQSVTPLAYTLNLNFMSGYGAKRGGTYALPGHTGYPNQTIFVFDEDFAVYCDQLARQLTRFKEDPNLFGYFSDNELPFRLTTLDGYLSLENRSDPGYLAANAWLARNGISEEDITDSERREFLAHVAETYFQTVSAAIRKYDPNHLFLGPRLYSSEKNNEQFMRTAGKYVDVLACNYYGRWTPVPEEMNNWTLWSGKPFLITEWYVKGEDSGLPNQSGAGWIVKTQLDRGLFYQNYALALLESGNCIGWHWFKYMDNDPTRAGAELSNVDANKGIVNNYYEEYETLTKLMGELNRQVFNLTDYFDQSSHRAQLNFLTRLMQRP